MTRSYEMSKDIDTDYEAMSIRIPNNLMEAIDEACEADDRSRPWVIRKVLKDHFLGPRQVAKK